MERIGCIKVKKKNWCIRGLSTVDPRDFVPYSDVTAAIWQKTR
jgi:hypothetical protein